ncbi:MAG TPA: TIGR01777 family oxidoreductase [Kofleriaceae bacterium]|jgi:uncharacterized protein (TIGR01777 family)|nr:TIGR01777 family oxidoreductase [Kofleriaceae bacterium]
MMRVVVTGATGLIGRPLVRALRARGDSVVALVRDEARARRALGPGLADVELEVANLEEPGRWQARLAADAVVHLAGEPIAARRLDARQKQRVRDSRVESTRVIVEGLEALAPAARPRVLVTASGIDYYGFANRQLDDDDPVAEDAPCGDEFLARVCQAWEAEAVHAEALGIRVVRMRTAVVLAPPSAGGALAKMVTPFKLFAGGRIGSGQQWFSWIHRDDVVAAYVAAISDERWRGPVNLVGPESVRNQEFARALGKALHRPAWMPVPAFAVRLATGELAESLLEGRRAVPAALERLGFAFAHPTVADALGASFDAEPS